MVPSVFFRPQLHALRWIAPVIVLALLGCAREEPEQKIEGYPVFQPVDPAETVQVPVAKPKISTEAEPVWTERSTKAEPSFIPLKKLFRKPLFEPLDLDVVTVYYENDPIPDAWLQEWSRIEGKAVIQKQLPPSGEIVRDADLFILSPQRLQQWIGQELIQSLPAGWMTQGINPALLAHSFDPENTYSRPWRWTPYLYQGRPTTEPLPTTDSFEKLAARPDSLWPNDPRLLTALRLKEQKISANTRKESAQRRALTDTTLWSKDRTASESECWSQLLEGKVSVTFLPASLRLTEAASAVDDIVWWWPQGGTIIRFEQLAIPTFSERSELAQKLIAFLLEPAQQNRMVADTGYFSVHGKPDADLARTMVALPNEKGWFDRAEFLMPSPAQN
jgi:spermidine/putrescine-binding protein